MCVEDRLICARRTAASHGICAGRGPISCVWVRIIARCYTYDGLGNLMTVTGDVGRLNQITSSGYDPVGNRVRLVDPDGNITISTYDVLRRLGTVTLPPELSSIQRGDPGKRFVTAGLYAGRAAGEPDDRAQQ